MIAEAPEPQAKLETAERRPAAVRPKAKPTKTDSVDWPKAKALRDAGWSYDKIGEELKVSGVTVAAHLKKMQEANE